MSWLQTQIDKGWGGPPGRPRGTTEAPYPLRLNAWYRVVYEPKKSHKLMPGTSHSYCGLTLEPDDAYLIDSGWDQFFWIVEENREPGSNHCGACSAWSSKWSRSADAVQLPMHSPIAAEEWERELGPEAKRRQAGLDKMAETVVGWFGGNTRITEDLR